MKKKTITIIVILIDILVITITALIVFFRYTKQEKEPVSDEVFFQEKNYQEEVEKITAIDGIIDKIEGNIYWIQDKKQNLQKVTIKDEKIINNRTEKEMEIEKIQEQDKIQISKVIQIGEELVLTEESNIRVTRNIKDEELKEELLETEEVAMSIENLNKKGNNIILTGKITDYYSQYEQQSFEVQVIVNKDTQIFSDTKNQLEELQKMKERADTIFVTFQKQEKQSGKLVAKNIEAMGC